MRWPRFSARRTVPPPRYSIRIAQAWLVLEIPELGIEEILGHSTPGQTARYAHLGTAHIRADLERLAGLVPGVRNEPAAAHAVAQLAECDAQVPVTKA
jgi:hypothetical protein